jgi:hypothetical protein
VQGSGAQVLDATYPMSQSIVDDGCGLGRYNLYEVFRDGLGLFDATQRRATSVMEPTRCLPRYDSIAMPMFTRSFDEVESYLDLRSVCDGPDLNAVALKDDSINGGQTNLFLLHPLYEQNASGTFPLPRAPVPSDLIDTSGSMTSDCPVLESQVPLSNQYASGEMWDTYRATITKLYRDENRTLKVVMSVMKEKYGFKAT